MKKCYALFIAGGALVALAGCSPPPPEAYMNRGDPENLLSQSSDVVNTPLESQTSITQLVQLVQENPPSRVTLNCSRQNALCLQAARVFVHYKIPAQWGQHDNSDVTVIYDHVTARECTNRYTDDSHNPYNLTEPALGCSLTSNTVQMVSDKREFTNPGLLDFSDGDKAEQVYGVYETPPTPPQAASSSSGSATSSTSSAVGGSSTGTQ